MTMRAVHLLLIVTMCLCAECESDAHAQTAPSIGMPMHMLITEISMPESDTLLNCEGLIRDSCTNENLIGANVVVEGTSKGAATNYNGRFRLQRIPKGSTLRFSFVGYETKRVPCDQLQLFQKDISGNTYTMVSASTEELSSNVV